VAVRRYAPRILHYFMGTASGRSALRAADYSTLRRVHRTLASLAILISILKSMHACSQKIYKKNPTADTASPDRRSGSLLDFIKFTIYAFYEFW